LINATTMQTAYNTRNSLAFSSLVISLLIDFQQQIHERNAHL